MHVISHSPFLTAIRLYPMYADQIEATYKALKASEAKTPEELKKVFPTLDNFKYVDKWYVINIGGGTLRLIAFLEFKGGKCFVKHIVSHAEYESITAQHRRKGSKK